MKARKGYPLVIIVDDEEYILEFMKSDLEVNGLEVKSFTCPNEALNFFFSLDKEMASEIFLITDYRMPDISGLDMIESLQEQSFDISKSVLLTGLIPKEDLERASLLEGVEVMEKPVDLDRIIAMVKSCKGQDQKSSESQEVL